MRRQSKEVTIFNLSMLDVMTGALGAVMIIMVVLLTQKMSMEEELSPQKLTLNAKDLTKEANKLTQEANKLAKEKNQQTQLVKDLTKKADKLAKLAIDLTKKASKLTKDEVLIKELREKLQAKAKELREREKKVERLEKLDKKSKGITTKVGFEIPKKVALVVDLSGSMIDNKDKENRMDQVRAGLKMMIATMNNEYKIDIVFFPAFANLKKTKECQALYHIPEKCKKDYTDIVQAYKKDPECYKYSSFNGKLISLKDDSVRYDFYKKMSCLEANYFTPTIPTLKYVFKTYPDIDGVILYSDGTPDAMKKGKSVDDLLAEIKRVNIGGKRIFTVGVGKEFREEKNTDAVNFLKKLAEENDGHYVGF